MKPVWIVDVDGTVALRREGGRGPFDWHRVDEDLPNTPVIIVVRALILAGDHVVFLSGRNAVCATATWRWLERELEDPTYVANDIMGGVENLFMRPDTAEWRFEPDDKLKRWLYETHVKPNFEVRGVIDDRNKVVRMWRELGLTCLQVAEGDF